MGIEVELRRAKPHGDKVHAGLDEPRREQQALAELMFAEAIRVSRLFECQVKRLACGRRADDVVGLFAEAIQPADGFV